MLCSVANAILTACSDVAECNEELLLVRETLMRPDGPGKLCGFGWDRALENLNFCSTEEYPILAPGWKKRDSTDDRDTTDDRDDTTVDRDITGPWDGEKYDDMDETPKWTTETESDNPRYLGLFWKNRKILRRLDGVDFENWQSDAYYYHYDEFRQPHGMAYTYDFLPGSPCGQQNFGDRTFVGREDILCSVANAILMQCQYITECNRELPFVRDTLMRPPNPGKWCGFGWEKALENLNYCSTKEYPILASPDAPDTTDAPDATDAPDTRNAPDSTDVIYLRHFWDQMKENIQLSKNAKENSQRVEYQWKYEANQYLYFDYNELYPNTTVYAMDLDPDWTGCNSQFYMWTTFKGRDNMMCSVAHAILTQCNKMRKCRNELDMVRQQLITPSVPGKWCDFGTDKDVANLNFCSTGGVLYNAFYDVLTQGSGGLNDVKVEKVLKKAKRRYNREHKKEIGYIMDPKWDDFVESLQNSEIMCTARNWCAFGDSVLHGCQKMKECRTKMDVLRQSLQDALASTCSVDYNDCKSWGP